MRNLTKWLAALTLATGLVFSGAAVAAAGGPPPGVGGGPPETITQGPPTTTVPGANCSHGVNDDGTCRPDPNENGQDCDEHGVPNPAGNDGNEDHCLTTTVVPTTTTEVPTTTVVETTTTVPTTTTTVPTTTAVTSTTTTSTVPDTTTTSVEPPTTVTEGGGDNPKPDVEKPGKLAFTGPEDVIPLGLGALGLLTTGTGLMWLGRKREDV